MTKDRLPEFQALVDEHELAGSMTHLLNHFASIDMESDRLKELFDQVQTLRTTIDMIAISVNHLEHLHIKMLACQGTLDGRIQIEQRMAEIQRSSTTVRLTLKDMKRVHEDRFIFERIRTFLITMLAKQFCILMDRYYQSVIDYRDKCKDKLIRQLEFAGIEKSDDQIEELLEQGHANISAEIFLETEQARRTLNAMETRHQDLLQLQFNIRLLRDMFLDFASQVELQDGIIDSIEKKMNEVEISGREIRKATYATKKVHRSCMKLFHRNRCHSSSLLSWSRFFSSCV